MEGGRHRRCWVSMRVERGLRVRCVSDRDGGRRRWTGRMPAAAMRALFSMMTMMERCAHGDEETFSGISVIVAI